MRRVWRVLFWLVVGASLLANAVTLGIVIRLGELRETMAGGAGFRDLPRETRAEFRAVLRESRDDLSGPLSDLGTARREMYEAAMAEPYDRAAVEAAMARVRTASEALQVAGQKVLLEAFDRSAEKRP